MSLPIALLNALPIVLLNGPGRTRGLLATVLMADNDLTAPADASQLAPFSKE
jgi:hypothetical protein